MTHVHQQTQVYLYLQSYANSLRESFARMNVLMEELGSLRLRARPFTRAQASGMHSMLTISISVSAQNCLNARRTCTQQAWALIFRMIWLT